MDFFKQRREDELRLMEKLARESSRFEFKPIGTPPDRYQVVFHCKGLIRLNGEEPVYDDRHEAEIILHPEYPVAENALEITWKSPILHPNIDQESGPCYKGTPLGTDIPIAEICEFIADMIQYKQYNLGNRWKSETSQQAAEWAGNHPEALPLDRTPLRDRIDATTSQ